MMADKEMDKEAPKAEAPAVNKETAGKDSQNKAVSKKKRGPWALILVVIVALAAIWFFAPAEIRQDVTGLFNQSKVERKTEPVKVVKPVAPTPKRIAAPVPPPQPTVSSEEVEALRETIESLKDGLRELRDESAILRKAMGERQLPDIRVRLNWIANPASTLDQIYFAWSDIAVAAGLDDEQRSQAEEMRDLAARQWQARRDWVAALEAVAEALMRSAEEDAGASGEATLQANFEKWVQDNFHLSRSDVGDRMVAAELESRVTKAIHMIRAEHWPETEPWQQLAHAIRDAVDQPPMLPDDFSSITSDVDALRSTARAWLEQL